MATTWILVADSSRARVLVLDRATGPLREIEGFVHPEGRLHEHDLTSDLPGRSATRKGAAAHEGDAGRHQVGTDESPKAHAIDTFAKQLADHLDRGRKAGTFARLVLIAPPEFLGLLRKHLSTETTRAVVKQVDKNLAQHDLEEIRLQLA